MSKKRGAPKKPKIKLKSRYLQVRIEQVEKDGFDAAAADAGLALAGWVRERLRDAARAELQKNGKDCPF